MADSEEFQNEKEIRINWKRMRAGMLGGLIGWLVAIALITPPFLLYYPTQSQNMDRILQASFMIPIFVLGMLGHWIGVRRYNRSQNKDSN